MRLKPTSGAAASVSTGQVLDKSILLNPCSSSHVIHAHESETASSKCKNQSSFGVSDLATRSFAAVAEDVMQCSLVQVYGTYLGLPFNPAEANTLFRNVRKRLADRLFASKTTALCNHHRGNL
jgi:hypothetical protein